MPAPDVCYGLDCSVTLCYITGDTHFYFYEICQDADEYYDSYSLDYPARTHGDRLADLGEHLESGYLSWRQERPVESAFASLAGASSWARQVDELSAWMGDVMADRHGGWPSSRYVQRAFEDKVERGARVVHRSMTRALHDFRRRDLNLIACECREWLALKRESRSNAVAQLRRQFAPKPAVVAKKRSETRGIVKRSIRMLSSLIGDEPTRLFIQGQSLIVEGELADYEIVKCASVASSGHGNCKLLARSKLDGETLGSFCILTNQAPLLDHVASLVMHIRSGEELDIFEIGNFHTHSERAYDELPIQRPKKLGGLDEFLGMPRLTEEKIAARDDCRRRARQWIDRYWPKGCLQISRNVQMIGVM